MSCTRICWLVTLLVTPLSLGCGNPIEDFLSMPLPPALPCDVDARIGADEVTGVSFDRADMLCVGIDMAPEEFVALQGESRMGGSTNEEMFEEVIGRLITGQCTKPLPKLYNWYQGDMRVGGIARSSVGVRKKGLLGSLVSNGRIKPSLKLDTDRYIDGQRLGPTERLTLNNNNQDPSRIRTCLAYDVFHAAGYPAPLCNLAAVMVNGEPMGAYAHVEPMKKRFLRRAFGDDSGSLYEGTISDFTVDYLREASVGNLGRWEAKTEDTDLRGAPLLALVEALRAPDDQLIDALEPVLDVERFITFWALETLIAHTDSYTGGINNFFVYFDPGDGGRATMLPWGVDAVFTPQVIGGFGDQTVGLAVFQTGTLARRLSRIPMGSAMYAAELRRLLDEVWDESRILADIDAYVAQVRTAQDDASYDETLAELTTWVQGRRGEIEEWLAEGVPEGPEELQTCGDAGFIAGLLDLATKLALAW